MASLLTSPPTGMIAPTLDGLTQNWGDLVARTDSPFGSISHSTSDSDVNRDSGYLTPASIYTASSATPEVEVALRKRASQASPPEEYTEAATKSASLRFFVVDDPKQLKDKSQLKANRQHVMHDYLDKERQNPASKDIRITKAGTSKRRKRSSVSYGRTSVSSASTNVMSSESSSASQEGRSSSVARSAPAQRELQQSRAICRTPSRSKHAPAMRPIRFADDISPFVRGIAGGFNNSRYLRACPEKIPAPQGYIGANIQPFGCWPKLDDPSLNVEQLKWSCSRKFGTRGISIHWVPALLKSKPAFLSTICISASHDDIMMRGLQAAHERLPFGSTARMRVRSEVLAMINYALADLETQKTDGTIIAILQVLHSEVMGCDETIMQIHQNGLHDLINQRGGLNKLGLNGQLASIITITMYMIAVLQEAEPRSEYIRYASQNRAKMHNSSGQIPESPLYTRPTGYDSVKRSIQESSPTFEVLWILRRLTHAFVRETTKSTSDSDSAASTESASVHSLRQWIFALHSSEAIADSFASTHARAQYEALRLTALVYAHALACRIPFSAASAQLSRVYNRNSGTCNLASDHLHNESIGSLSWHTLIQKSLIKTNLSDCWGHMGGVLYFVTLVAGGCANPDSRGATCRKETSEEEDESRKWLAAVTVRCSIVLSFEYGEVVLDTLKRLVGIQQVLSKGQDQLIGYCDTMPVASTAVPGAFYGPAEPPMERQTFADYAMDFMNGL